MKELSVREKVLLSILAFLLLCVVAVRYLLMPAYNRKTEAAANLMQAEQQKQEMDLLLKSMTGLDQRLDEEKIRAASDSFLYKNLSDTEVDRMMQKIAADTGVTVTALNVRKTANTAVKAGRAGTPGATASSASAGNTGSGTSSSAKAEAYGYELAAAAGEARAAGSGTQQQTNQSSGKTGGNAMLSYYDCSITVSGFKEAIVKLADTVDTEQKSRYVTSITTTESKAKNVPAGTLNGQISVRFYFLEE